LSRGYKEINGPSGQERAFFINDGGILYAVRLIPVNEETGSPGIPAKLGPARADAFKNVFIVNIFVSGQASGGFPETLLDHINSSSEYDGQKIYEINWGVSLKPTGGSYDFYHSKNQPDKVLYLRAVIDECARLCDTPGPRAVKTNEPRFTPLKKISNPVLTYAIMVICGAYLAVMELNGGSTDSATLIRFGALFKPAVLNGEYHRLFTAMFLHIGAMHLVSNALGMYIIATRVEKYFGTLKFLLIYFVSGLFGNFLCLMLSEGILAGASGAVFGAEGALLALVLKTGKPADGFTPLFILIFATAGLCFSALFPNVANLAHAGGLLCGFLMGWALYDEGKAIE